MLAALSLFLSAHALFTAALFSVLAPARTPRIEPVLVGAGVTYAAVYLLARSTRAQLGVYCLIGVQLALPALVSTALGPAYASPRSAAAWMTLAVLTSSAMLGRRTVLAVGAAATIVFSTLAVALRFHVSTLGEPMMFLIGITLVTYVYARHRDSAEVIRRRELRERNRALRDLSASLERRVAERTRDLENAYHTLQKNHAVLLQTEKMAVIGRLTAGFAHELASPLGALMSSVSELNALRDQLARGVADGAMDQSTIRKVTRELEDVLDIAGLSVNRMALFVRGIRSQTRNAGPSSYETFDLLSVASEAVQLVQHAARAGNVRIDLSSSGTLEMCGAPTRLSQALLNLLQNAVDATSEKGGGSVAVRLAARGDEIAIEIQDDGPGIPEAAISRIFEPLFTTKPVGHGTGLGLCIVSEVVEREHRGQLEVKTCPGMGTTFSVFLPREANRVLTAGEGISASS